jgi:hypothetical protein
LEEETAGIILAIFCLIPLVIDFIVTAIQNNSKQLGCLADLYNLKSLFPFIRLPLFVCILVLCSVLYTSWVGNIIETSLVVRTMTYHSEQ